MLQLLFSIFQDEKSGNSENEHEEASTATG